MTQELNKEALKQAVIAWEGPHFTIKSLESAIQAYLSHPKVTGFDDLPQIIHLWGTDNGCIFVQSETEDLANRIKAALAGGGHDR